MWKGRLGASFSCFLGPVAAASYACICNLKLAGGWCGWSGWTLVVSLKAELELKDMRDKSVSDLVNLLTSPFIVSIFSDSKMADPQ